MSQLTAAKGNGQEPRGHGDMGWPGKQRPWPPWSPQKLKSTKARRLDCISRVDFKGNEHRLCKSSEKMPPVSY